MPCCFPASWRRSASAARKPSPARKPPRAPTSPLAWCCKKTRRSTTRVPDDLHKVGTVAEILRYVTAPDGSHHIVARGTRRFRITEFLPDYPFLVALVDEIGEAEVFSTEVAARMHQLKERAREALSLMPQMPQELADALEQIQSPAALADFVASASDLPPAEKQDLLETFDVQERLDKVLRHLVQQIEVLRISKQIGEQTQESLQGRQREHILREQLRQIQKELGEDEGTGAEIAELREAIEKAKMPEEAEKQALKELKRLERTPEASAEHSMIRTYLDWLVELPWSTLSERPNRHRRSAPHPRRGPLRAAQDQAAHPRVPRRAQAQSGRQEPDSVLRRSSRRGQDLARAVDRARHWPKIPAHQPRRPSRRGRDPRPSAHLYRGAARQHHPGHSQGRDPEPRAHAR